MLPSSTRLLRGNSKNPGAKKDQQGIQAKTGGHNGENTNRGQISSLDCCASEIPNRLDNHCHHHRFHSMQRCACLRQRAITNIEPSQQESEKSSRKNEAYPGNNKTWPAGQAIADLDSHLSGVGAGNKIHYAKKIQKLFAGEPLTAANNLVIHHGNVRSRAAECGHAQPRIQERQFAQPSGFGPLLRTLYGFLRHHTLASSDQAPAPRSSRTI